MKKKLLVGLALGLMLIGSLGTANATSITVERNTVDPVNLNHNDVYLWGVQSSTWNSLVNPITSASITLTQIWDFNNSGYDDDQLALFLLDDAFMNNTYSAWRSITDDSVITPAGFANSLLKADSTSNLFDQIAPLVTYNVTEDIQNSSSQKVDLTYNFTSADLTTLQAYLTDPTPGSSYRDIALGIDPDCHFQLDKISFTVSDNIKPVPEPATMLLMGTGLSGLIGARRKKA